MYSGCGEASSSSLQCGMEQGVDLKMGRSSKLLCSTPSPTPVSFVNLPFLFVSSATMEGCSTAEEKQATEGCGVESKALSVAQKQQVLKNEQEEQANKYHHDGMCRCWVLPHCRFNLV